MKNENIRINLSIDAAALKEAFAAFARFGVSLAEATESFNHVPLMSILELQLNQEARERTKTHQCKYFFGGGYIFPCAVHPGGSCEGCNDFEAEEK